MKPGTVTIPTLLKKAGYVTGLFGKWGLGAPGSASDPAVFFDEVFGYNCQRQSHTFYPKHLWHNKKKVPLDGKTYSHDLILQAAMDFIKANKEKPFFCYMPVTIPHAAMHAPKDLHDKYRKRFPQFENKVGKYAGTQVQNPVAAFPAMVEHLDNGVGEILALLKKLGLDDNTLVIFTSDNGPHREGGHDPGFWDSNGPLKGLKRDLYEGGIRVPFLARWPGKIKPGSASDHISAFWDMLPTFCEMAGIAAPKDTDGISILPALLDKKQKEHDYLYWEFTERGGSQALRSDLSLSEMARRGYNERGRSEGMTANRGEKEMGNAWIDVDRDGVAYGRLWLDGEAFGEGGECGHGRYVAQSDNDHL